MDKYGTLTYLVFPKISLLEVLDAALNERLELIARGELGDVLVEARARALRVTHLAQDTAVGAGNTLDSQDGAVRVNGEAHARSTCCVNVLCCNLTVCLERFKQLVGGNKAAFSMADSNGVDVAKRALGEPWGHR